MSKPKPPPLPPRGWIATSSGLFDDISDEEIESLLDFSREKSNNKELKCECGADATYKGNAPSHSDWCPKYEE